MNQRLLITLGVLSFLIIGTYIAIKWAEGYRYNLSQRMVEGTGLLVANSMPQGASVYLDDLLTTATDDTLHLQPGDYQIRLEKDGYTPWQKKLKIEKELVTQTNARLFPSVPSLSAITVNSATDPHASPDGQKIAYKIGAKVLGSDIHQIVSLPAYQLMDFCSAICDEPPKWKYNAGEQLESFLSIGWPVKPENLD